MASSTVPLPAAFFHAVLHQLSSKSEGVRRKDLYELVADEMALTPEQRAERLPSLTHLRYRHRIGWSMNLLKNAGLIASPASGIWRLTVKGQETLIKQPAGFDEQATKAITYAASKAGAKQAGGGEEEEAGDTGSIAQQPPEERIEVALGQIRDSVSEELIDRIMQAPPVFFEKLVLQLLRALGYGERSEDLRHIGGTGDGGIDGVISLDRLGFEKVVVQAKRWQGSVGRPEIHAFYGALAGRQAKKGVFITTSTYTKEAQSFAAQVAGSIVLIDGTRLTELMIEYGVAVANTPIQMPRVDSDFFET